MNLNDLLQKHGITPADVLVLRHRPVEPKLRRALPWLAVERPELYNAVQQTQSPRVEKTLKRAKYVASFIGTTPRAAVFAGLYAVNGWKELSYKAYLEHPANIELREAFEMKVPTAGRGTILWFNLTLVNDFFDSWRGCLVVDWPGGERSWYRWASKNTFPVQFIRETNGFEAMMPKWNELVLTWAELKTIRSRWKAALKEWRGIYYIWDSSDGSGYVGSAYGNDNILGRWLNYGASGHGGNKRLKARDPRNFQFSILQRVSPDMLPDEIIELENTWKARLHTRESGLNEN